MAKADKSTDTNPPPEKGLAPFSIVVHDDAKLLNTIVFGSKADSVLLSPHLVQYWTPLTTQQLVNWPCVNTRFRNCDISFTRSNLHDFKRFISDTMNNATTMEPSPFIDSIDLINPNIPENHRKSYSLNLLQTYATQLLETLRNSFLIPSTKLNDIQVVLNEFLLDVNEINVGQSMASNTSIVFRIGGSVYCRNKILCEKISNSANASTVLYSEVITPKMNLLFSSFLNSTIDDGNRDLDVTEAFVSLNKFRRVQSTFLGDITPVIEYRCNFCAMAFTTDKEKMLHHLYLEHSMENPMFCIECKNFFKVQDLSENRWYHQCTNNELVAISFS